MILHKMVPYLSYLLMIEEVASSESSFPLKIQMQNTQTLQLLTLNISSEIVYKRYQKCQATKLDSVRSMIYENEGHSTQGLELNFRTPN